MHGRGVDRGWRSVVGYEDRSSRKEACEAMANVRSDVPRSIPPQRTRGQGPTGVRDRHEQDFGRLHGS